MKKFYFSTSISTVLSFPTLFPCLQCRRDGTWGGADAICMPARCAALPDAPNMSVEPAAQCQAGAARPGTLCHFRCHNGYKLTGPSAARCTRARRWKGLEEGVPECKPDFPDPFILCPPDVTKALPGKASSVYVMFAQPKTNVDWFRWGFASSEKNREK